MPDALPAVAIWREVREQLRPFVDAAPLKIPDRDLGEWAQRAHSGWRREFGQINEARVSGINGLNVEALRHLQAGLNEVPGIADVLTRTLADLADHGELQSLATRLPFRETRLYEFTAHRPVVADREDVAVAAECLTTAATLAASTALDLDRATASTVGRDQPGLVAAHEARVTPTRDPHAALVADAEMGGDERAAIADTFGAVPWNGDVDVDSGIDLSQE